MTTFTKKQKKAIAKQIALALGGMSAKKGASGFRRDGVAART
jgi:hypothetical protein